MPIHRIGRQVLEVAGCAREDAGATGAALRALYFEQLVPLIDEACTALAGPDRLLRIDRLEIDLGALPWDDPPALQARAAERLARALSARLASAAVLAPELAGEQELIERFALTGALPWWADPAERGHVAAAIGRVLGAPAVARALLRALAGRPDAWLRLMAHGKDAPWERWVAHALPDWPPPDAARWQALADAAAPGDRADEGPGRRDATLPEFAARWWPPLVAAAAGAGEGGAARLIGDTLVAFAGQLGHDPQRLWLRWRDAMAQRGADLAGVGAALDRRFGGAVDTTRRSSQTEARLGTDDERLAAQLARWTDIAAGRALWGRLASVLRRLPPVLRRAAAASRASPAALAALVEAALAQGLVAAEAVDDWIAAELAAASSSAAEPLRAALRALPRRPASLAAPHEDKLAVGNAGLVLLWPFLGHFFERLGLVAERRFVDAAAAQLAARLLHGVASGDMEPAEYQLPLCKLLCGLDLAAALDGHDPLPEAMLAEGEAMLRAVIERAPVLREMSVAGFRGSFLLRRGLLGARDGHHLLQVEREAWDIVIERFGWSAGMVRLPWMDGLLEVQW